MKPLASVLIAVVALTGGLVNAHESRPLYFELTELQPNQFQLDWRFPASLAPFERPSVGFEENCRLVGTEHLIAVSGILRLDCSDSPNQMVLTFPSGNPSLSTVLQYKRLGFAPQLIQVGPGQAIIPLPGRVREGSWWSGYFALGVDHILGGLDHLLLVACLVILLPSLKALLLAVTGFTLAHSLTLGLAALEFITVPMVIVEALIALSIVALAAELLYRDGPSLGQRYPILVSGTIGLLHGLGFASALREMGLPEEDVLVALFAFNIGVEAGQLGFVALFKLVVIVWYQLRQVPDIWRRGFPELVGVLAAFWFFQRLLLGLAE